MILSAAAFADTFFHELDPVAAHAAHNSLGNALKGGSSCWRTRHSAGHAFPMDIVETSTAYEVQADTPGLAAEDIKVELLEGVLTISGERKVSHRVKVAGGKVWRSERPSYSFSRAFTLPDDADSDRIAAHINKGVLAVTVPKRRAPGRPAPKRIAVTGS